MNINYLQIRKTSFITLFLIFTLFLSCSKKNNLTNSDLTGTTWKSNYIGHLITLSDGSSYYYPDYKKLNFTANNAYYEYDMVHNSNEYMMSGAGFYAIKGNQITLNSAGLYTGTINGNTISIVIDGVSIIYTKQ